MNTTKKYDQDFFEALSRQRVSNQRVEMARCELIDREDHDFDDIEDQYHSVAGKLESPIEEIALYHLLGRNYAPIIIDEKWFARVSPAEPEIFPEGQFIFIAPQVKVAKYRVDFMVYLSNWKRFAIECDGKDFHDDITDGFRDGTLAKFFDVPVIRVKGSEIWESPLWTNNVRKMVLMLLGVRHAEG